jgi:hypothetical protein
MNAATASEIARFETMTITKVVEKFESLGASKPTSTMFRSVGNRSSPGTEISASKFPR